MLDFVIEDPLMRNATRSEGPPSSAREIRRLRTEVLLAFALKLLAILALGFVFFGPSHRPHISPEALFLPAGPNGPESR